MKAVHYLVLISFVLGDAGVQAQDTNARGSSVDTVECAAFVREKHLFLSGRQYVNENQHGLDLTEKEVLTLATRILKREYGRREIAQQTPLKVCKVDQYWVVRGQRRKAMKGGTATIVINGSDGAVEYLIHTR